ncbi:hypothetical protein U1Q18_038248 [Sarracenia purpurea var. burkii]
MKNPTRIESDEGKRGLPNIRAKAFIVGATPAFHLSFSGRRTRATTETPKGLGACSSRAKPLSPLPPGWDLPSFGIRPRRKEPTARRRENEIYCFADNPLAIGDLFTDLTLRRYPSNSSDLNDSVHKDKPWEEREEKDGLQSGPFCPRILKSLVVDKPDPWSPSNTVRRRATKKNSQEPGAKNPPGRSSARPEEQIQARAVQTPGQDRSRVGPTRSSNFTPTTEAVSPRERAAASACIQTGDKRRSSG